MRLLGLDFADLDAVAAAELLARRSPTEPFGYVTTPNADHLVRLHRQPHLLPLYQQAMMRLLDSHVVAMAAHVIGLPTPSTAPGSDVTELLMKRHLKAGERITVVGLSPQWLPALIARCDLAPPAHYDPPRGFERHPAAMRTAVEFVVAHQARFTFLAVGSPRQEMLAAAIRATGRALGIGLCIGASLEFIAGATPRAPAWMRRSGLEWLYRLSRDPGRLARRYLIDSPGIFRLLLQERCSNRRACNSPISLSAPGGGEVR